MCISAVPRSNCFIIALLLVLPRYHGSIATEIDHDIGVSSAVADTTQILFREEVATNAGFAVITKRHQIVCFQRRKQLQLHHYNAHHDVEEARESCCLDIYQSRFLTERHDQKYCLDRIAMVRTATTTNDNIIGNADMVGEEKSISSDSLVPTFYLSWDDEEEAEAPTKSLSVDFNYNQRRHLNFVDKAGRESFHDGMMSNEAEAYSPFHLTDFMPNVNSRSNRITTYPLRGYVEGSLSNEGGMHRSYRQSVHLMLGTPRSNNGGLSMNVNVTILLPISESVFIDADDPLHVEYKDGTPDGIFCKITLDKSGMSRSSSCNIQFASPETIDIEQPSFASRQYVVVYELNAELDFPNPNDIPEDKLDIVLEYSTTLHVRYPAPISSVVQLSENDEMVPVIIQQPVLYSASVSLRSNDEVADQLYSLHADVNASKFSEHNAASRENIIIRVAAGLDNDHGWVTALTLSLAMLGGFVLTRSLDSISIWV